MRYTLITFTLLLIASSASAQESFSSVEEQMTGKEFSATGLSKLSPEELAALNSWLRAHTVATLDDPKAPVNLAAGSATATPGSSAPSGDLRGFEGDSRSGISDESIVTRLVGKSNGWGGQTVFRLENGMVWQQTGTDRFYISQVENPSITIDKGLFDAWFIKFDGYNSETRVHRLE